MLVPSMSCTSGEVVVHRFPQRRDHLAHKIIQRYSSHATHPVLLWQPSIPCFAPTQLPFSLCLLSAASECLTSIYSITEPYCLYALLRSSGRPGIHAMFPTNGTNLMDYLEPANQPPGCDTRQPLKGMILYYIYYRISIISISQTSAVILVISVIFYIIPKFF